MSKFDKTKKRGDKLLSMLPMLLYCAAGIIGGLALGEYLVNSPFENASPVLRFLFYIFMFLCVFLILYLDLMLHEVGHLIFGLLTGYRFVSFRIGSLMWQRGADGRIHTARLKIAGTGGQCLLAPPPLDQTGRMPALLYHLGGCILGLIAGMLGWIGWLCIPNTYPLLRLFVLFATVFNFAFVLVNGIPLRTSLIVNDGYNAWNMRRNPNATRSLWMQLTINEQLSLGKRLRDLPKEWFDEESIPSVEIAVMRCMRLMDECKLQEADAAMQALLAKRNDMLGIHRNLLICERIFCEILGENRPAVIDELRTPEVQKFMKMMRTSPSVLRTEYAYAMLTDFDEKKANEALVLFEKCAAKYPNPQEIEGERELLAMVDATKKQE